MKNKLLRAAISAVLAAATWSTAQVVSAQEGAQVAGGLEEIIVTATRREQDLQEVPVSIVALTGDTLELHGLDSLEDVGNAVPNINIQGGGLGTYGTRFTVRGLPNIGVYVDGVWQVGTSGFLLQEFVDVDRIEVLRGPQGTTYGRDAVGGAIRIWTRAPSDEFGGTFTATTGTHDRRDVKGVINVPLSESLTTKWTLASLYRDGHIEGLAVNQDFGETDQDVYRGDIVWTPSDTFSARLTVSDDNLVMTDGHIHQAVFDTAHIPGARNGIPFDVPCGASGTPTACINNSGVIAPQFYGLAVEGARLRPPELGGPVELGIDAVTPENYVSGYPGGKVGKWENRSSATLPNHIRHEQTTLDINWDVTDSISIQSLTSTTKQLHDVNVDWDELDYALGSDMQRRRLELFSEEIQIQGGGDRISWLAGLYYWDQTRWARDARFALDEFRTLEGDEGPQLLFEDAYRSQRCQELRNPETNPFNLRTCESAAGSILRQYSYDRLGLREQDGWAAFGEATITLTDRMDLTVGMRHHDQNNAAYTLLVVPGVSVPRPRTADMLHGPGDIFAGELRASTEARPNPRRVQFDQTTYKAALQMQFNDDIMGYLSYSEGFDSGGISSTTTSIGVTLFPYEPQIIENTEIGIRSDLMGGLLRFNATVFASDWLNIQNRGVVRDPGTGEELPQLVTTNVGRASANGVELELTFVPTDNLTFNVNLGLLSTGYDDIAEGTFSLDETTEFAQAPDMTYNLGVQYVADFAGGGTLTTRVDYSYTDQFWRSLPFLRMDWLGPKNGGPIPPSFDESGDWATLNARFVYAPPAGNWEVAAFGTNLTNEYMLNAGFIHQIWGFDFAAVSRPREAGVSLKVNF